MKALITGGCGFIGSHLAEILLTQGHEVIIIDNLESGRLNNIEHLQSQSGLTFYQYDILDFDKIEPCFKSVDWVFHLAGMADIVPSIDDPGKYYHCNVTGTFNVLEAAKNQQVKKLVYAASSSCYGIPDSYPTPETAEIRPQYPYALTKYMGEELVLHWGQTYKIPVMSLRLFNVYGPRSRTAGAYGAVFGVFLAQKFHNKPFTVVGDGTQTRDFTYVTDVARAFIKAAESSLTGKILNVGSDNHYSINYLVKLLGGEITYVPKRPGEPDCTYADTGKIQKLLDWKPEVSFEDGVSIMLQQLEKWQDAPVWNPDSIKQATATWFEYLGS
ncbi:MAG TPA: SDR family oxidoreductase [Aeromonadales bacterium]|nr:SDR family oxidoreductase [Aeromonadales bacterium]